MKKKLIKKIIVILFTTLYIVSTQAKDLSQVDFKVLSPVIGNGQVKVREGIADNERAHREHSVKYYSYQASDENDEGDFSYYDVAGVYHKMTINKNAYLEDVDWDKDASIMKKGGPLNYDFEIGVDVSTHNGDINWKKVKEAGMDFAIIRLVYRGYGEKGTLKEDERGVKNLLEAKKAGLKVGAYIFSQAVNESETIEEAEFAIKLLNDNGIVLDLPLVYDPETIKGAVARTDNVTGETFTKNAIAFSEHVKKKNLTPAIYANMIWQDFYLDMGLLREYDFWYADYFECPWTPYKYRFWQFSERGKVPGITDKGGYVDLNIMLLD